MYIVSWMCMALLCASAVWFQAGKRIQTRTVCCVYQMQPGTFLSLGFEDWNWQFGQSNDFSWENWIMRKKVFKKNAGCFLLVVIKAYLFPWLLALSMELLPTIREHRDPVSQCCLIQWHPRSYNQFYLILSQQRSEDKWTMLKKSSIGFGTAQMVAQKMGNHFNLDHLIARTFSCFTKLPRKLWFPGRVLCYIHLLFLNCSEQCRCKYPMLKH